MKKIILIFFLFLICEYSFCQSKNRITNFTEDKTLFIEELNKLMLSSPSEERRKTMKVFSKKWKGETFSDLKRKYIYNISNLMLKQRKKANHFEKMINAIVSFSNSENFDSQFENWILVVEKLLNSSATSKQMKFFAFSENLFKDKVLIRNRSLEWKINSNSYSFQIDSLPKLIFQNPIDLYCIARGDTMLISNTTGIYYPMKSFWIGNYGVVDWTNAGYFISEIYAELNNYNISMRTPSFTADSVRFFNNLIFSDAHILGKLEHKLVSSKKETQVNYPKFDSYDKKIKLSDLIDNVDFIGGYSLHGNKFISNSESGDYAKLVFYRKNNKFLEATTSRITITNNRVIAKDASIKIILLNDSIIHPGLDLMYNQDDMRLDLIRDEQGISAAPYFNSYHNLEMYFQVLKWNINNDFLSFGSMPSLNSKQANFESSNFYSEQHFNSLLGIDDIHPLSRLKKFVKDKEYNNEFFIEDFILSSKLSVDQANRFLIWMSAEGFLLYNMNTGKVEIKDRLYRYIASKAKKIDYDVINFRSSTPENNKNAILDLNSMDLTIFGIDAIQLSSVRDVIAQPRNKQIVVQKNRDFTMSGRLIAGSGGRFNINCESIYFDYDQFKMQFKDAITEIRIPNNKEKYNEKGELELELLESEITIANGELIIDKNINKSGLWKDKYPEYPIIKSYDNSKVYYDKKDIFNGIYSREDFFFSVDPFEIDSLDLYTRESLSFPGEFYSADILPVFREELKVQDDNLLGFSINIPEEGYSLYIDKGYFTGNNLISLNKSGLRGSGEFRYLSSITQSDDYVFFPDSMNTHANSFNLIKDDFDIPNANGKDIYELWKPYEDVLKIKSKKYAFNLYDSIINFDGVLYFSPNNLTGGGIVNMEESEISSKHYSFIENSFNSDTADFVLNRSDLDAIAFQSKNVKTNIDLINRTGFFKSNGAGSFVTFPENEYICFIDELTWFMDKEEVILGSSVNNNGFKFISINKKQDSLSFNALSASYNLIDYLINADGVKDIKVADANIVPNNENIIIETNANIRTLDSAKINIIKEDFIHNLFNASLNIFSRTNYSGEASYLYKNSNLDDQLIIFSNISVIDTQTIGKGSILDEQNFKFSDQFGYKGEVLLEGSNKDLFYSGAYKIKHNCNIIPTSWISFNSYVGSEAIMFPIKNSLDDSGQKLSIGPIISDSGIYPTFLSLKDDENDIEIVNLSGYLSYDSRNDKFNISNDKDSLANVLVFDPNDCSMNGNGELNLGLNLGRVKSSSFGDFIYKPMSNIFYTDLMFSLDFYFNEDLIEQMGNELYNDPMADELELEEDFYLSNFEKILNDEEIVFEYDMYGEFEKLPKELNKSLYFYNVKFNWDNLTKSLVSENMLGLGNIKNFQINKLYSGHIELIKDISGDEINIYLETDIGEWYFFNYSNELLLTRSSLDDYNLILLETKENKRKAPSKNKKFQFEYDIANEEQVDDFKKKYFK